MDNKIYKYAQRKCGTKSTEWKWSQNTIFSFTICSISSKSVVAFPSSFFSDNEDVCVCVCVCEDLCEDRKIKTKREIRMNWWNEMRLDQFRGQILSIEFRTGWGGRRGHGLAAYPLAGTLLGDGDGGGGGSVVDHRLRVLDRLHRRRQLERGLLLRLQFGWLVCAGGDRLRGGRTAHGARRLAARERRRRILRRCRHRVLLDIRWFEDLLSALLVHFSLRRFPELRQPLPPARRKEKATSLNQKPPPTTTTAFVYAQRNGIHFSNETAEAIQRAKWARFHEAKLLTHYGHLIRASRAIRFHAPDAVGLFDK